MALILHIDTSVEAASICLAKDEKIIFFLENEKKKDHAAWLHMAIKKGIEDAGIHLKEIHAICVAIGPGSYTGLRIGLAAAKGLCYALNKPLIGTNTLKVMANAVKDEADELICPLIDARRMEVFTAVFNKQLDEIISPLALVIDEKSFDEELKEHRILFCGNGLKKTEPIIKSINALFTETGFDSRDMVSLSEALFNKREFLDLAYSEPIYLKEFYTKSK